MREQTKSITLHPDDGGSVTITPNGADAKQGITLLAMAVNEGQPDAERSVKLKLDGDTTDALVAAVYDAQGKRYRPGRSQAQGQD